MKDLLMMNIIFSFNEFWT